MSDAVPPATRRGFLATSATVIAAAGTLGFLPARLAAAATQGGAIRPFRVEIPEDALTDLRKARWYLDREIARLNRDEP